MDSLNRDVIACILSHLSFKDRLRLEATSWGLLRLSRGQAVSLLDTLGYGKRTCYFTSVAEYLTGLPSVGLLRVRVEDFLYHPEASAMAKKAAVVEVYVRDVVSGIHTLEQYSGKTRPAGSRLQHLRGLAGEENRLKIIPYKEQITYLAVLCECGSGQVRKGQFAYQCDTCSEWSVTDTATSDKSSDLDLHRLQRLRCRIEGDEGQGMVVEYEPWYGHQLAREPLRIEFEGLRIVPRQ